MITPSGNKVHRNGTIVNGQKISVEGRTIIQPKVTLRGDIANISTGRYCFIGQNTQLRPSSKKFKGLVLSIPFFHLIPPSLAYLLLIPVLFDAAQRNTHDSNANRQPRVNRQRLHGGSSVHWFICSNWKWVYDRKTMYIEGLLPDIRRLRAVA